MPTPIIYSNKLRYALLKMKSDPIADILLNIENKNYNSPSNYFDLVMDKNEFISYIPHKKAEEILKDTKEEVVYIGQKGGFLTHNIKENGEIFNELGYEPDGEKAYIPKYNDEIGEVIKKTISKTSGKLYLYVKFQNGKGVYGLKVLKPINDEKIKKVWTTNRQEIRIGRIVRILLALDEKPIIDKNIEEFVNQLKAVIDVMNDKFSLFDIVSGDDLGFWYHKNNYFKLAGNLGSSCQSPGRLDWLDIYIKNPDVVKLLILRSDEDPTKITGRALLWKLETPDNFYMDCTYTIRDQDRNLFEEYCKEKEWLSYSECGYRKTLITHIKPGTYRSMPSIDTMNNWDKNTGKLSNKEFDGCEYTKWRMNDDPDYDYESYHAEKNPKI